MPNNCNSLSESPTTPAQDSYNVLVIGDGCEDHYHWGQVARLNPEAPVPLLDHTHSETRAGMAWNVARNLEALGVTTTQLIGHTGHKHRYMHQGSGRALLRMDQTQSAGPLCVEDVNWDVDAVVVSDYNKGSVTEEVYDHIRTRCPAPVFVDTKRHDLSPCGGMIVKLNQSEWSRAINREAPVGIVITLGDRGARWNDRVFPSSPVPTFDVCGAGDTFLAALVWRYLSTQDIDHSIQFANRAAAVTVQHVGVYAPTLQEIEHDT